MPNTNTNIITNETIHVTVLLYCCVLSLDTAAVVVETLVARPITLLLCIGRAEHHGTTWTDFERVNTPQEKECWCRDEKDD